jgi:hypothetical protein
MAHLPTHGIDRELERLEECVSSVHSSTAGCSRGWKQGRNDAEEAVGFALLFEKLAQWRVVVVHEDIPNLVIAIVEEDGKGQCLE